MDSSRAPWSVVGNKMSASNAIAMAPSLKVPRVGGREGEPSFSFGSSANPTGIVLIVGRQVYWTKSRIFVARAPSGNTVPMDRSGNPEDYFGRGRPNLRAHFRAGDQVRRRGVLSAETASDERNQIAMMGNSTQQTSSPGHSVEETPTTPVTPNLEVGWFNAAIFSLGGAALFGILVMLFAVYVLDKWISKGWVIDAVMVCGALAVALAGITWIVVAWVVIWITVKRWWKSRS